MNITISISSNIKHLLPKSRLGVISASVKCFTPDAEFDGLLASTIANLQRQLEVDKESTFPVIQDSRDAYKACGKQPGRYRPSAEALLRRIRTGKGLYRINNIVDTINLLSISSHFSIGGFNSDRIDGPIELSIGNDQPYLAIGRGELNIEFMPGLRDSVGFFGTPTSDSGRTMVDAGIRKLLLVYYDFGGDETLNVSLDRAAMLLGKYCKGTEITTSIID